MKPVEASKASWFHILRVLCDKENLHRVDPMSERDTSRMAKAKDGFLNRSSGAAWRLK